MPGTFVYTPGDGTRQSASGGVPTVLPVGNNILSVVFTPADIVNYTTATDSVILVVTKGMPQVSWVTPAPVPSGTALSVTQLDAVVTLWDRAGYGNGTFVYNPPLGTVETTPGNHTLTATFTPTDTTDWTSPVVISVTLTVNAIAVAPTITWATPAPLPIGGSILTATELDATANTPGVFVYTPAAGTMILVTTTLHVMFTPSDTSDFTNGSAQTTLVVNTGIQGAVSFDFDDGFLSFYENAFVPIFKNPKNNPKGFRIDTFIITDDGVDIPVSDRVSPTGFPYGPDNGPAPGYITVPDLMDEYNSGLVEVSDHTRHHPYLTTCDLDGKILCKQPVGEAGRGQYDEIIGAQVDLFNYWGITANTFAFPYGDFSTSWTVPARNMKGKNKVDTIDILDTDGVNMPQMTYPSLTGLSGGITPFVGARTTSSGNMIGDNKPFGSDCGPNVTKDCPFPSFAYKLSSLIVDTGDNNCFNTKDPGCSLVDPLTTIQAEIDLAQENGNWLILVMHRVDDEAAGDGISISSHIIQEIVDYCVLKNTDVITQSQGVAKYGLPKTSN